MPNRFWGTTAAPKGVAFVARTEVPDTTAGSIGRPAALVGRQHWSDTKSCPATAILLRRLKNAERDRRRRT
jgi:hypothetical protein